MDDLVERARALAPLVTEYRAEGEAMRALPRPVYEAIREGGFFRLWVPRSLGGLEADPETSLRVVEEFARQDGSVGWNVMIAGNNSILWGYLQREAAAQVMAGNASAVLAGSILAGSGTATRLDEQTYRISGRWPFASGCRHCDFFVAGCHLAEAPDQLRAFIMPATSCTILDTWDTAGLRGTGSHDFVAEDVEVALAHSFPFPFPGGCQPGPMYNTLFAHLWAPNIAAVALGIARDAIETFIGIAAGKRTIFSQSVLAQRETIQERVGRAEALLRSGRAFVFETLRDNWAILCSGGALSDEQSALIRLAATTAAANAVEVVDMLFAAAGSTSIYTRSRLERCFRDVHMVPQHTVAGPSAVPMAGRVFLGLGLSR